MKNPITLLVWGIIGLPMTVAANVGIEYTFRYELSKEKYEVRVTDTSWEAAFESAAKKCFHFYITKKPRSEEYGLDVIDTCANPR